MSEAVSVSESFPSNNFEDEVFDDGISTCFSACTDWEEIFPNTFVACDPGLTKIDESGVTLIFDLNGANVEVDCFVVGCARRKGNKLPNKTCCITGNFPSTWINIMITLESVFTKGTVNIIIFPCLFYQDGAKIIITDLQFNGFWNFSSLQTYLFSDWYLSLAVLYINNWLYRLKILILCARGLSVFNNKKYYMKGWREKRVGWKENITQNLKNGWNKYVGVWCAYVDQKMT